jgi:hypothetical protein
MTQGPIRLTSRRDQWLEGGGSGGFGRIRRKMTESDHGTVEERNKQGKKEEER